MLNFYYSRDYADVDTETKLNEFDFLTMFQRMLVIEDLDSLKMMEDYSLTFQKVKRFIACRPPLQAAIEKHLKFLMCNRKMKDLIRKSYIIEATKKMKNDAQEFDYVYLTDMADYQNFSEDLDEIAEHRITGKVSYIFDNLIMINLVATRSAKGRQRLPLFLDEDRPYHVEFIPNRICTRVAHRAVLDAKNQRLEKYLKDFTNRNSQEIKAEKPVNNFKWMNKAIVKNMEQKTAVRNIVNRSSFPAPYIVFGPPGTGKSTTIIEAIAQIVALKPLSHVLVTVSSNSACDDIGNRLLKYVSKNKILRLYSPAFDHKPEKISNVLQPISNFRDRFVCKCGKRSCPEIQPCDDPTYEEFYTSRVIVATLASCGRIVSAGVCPDHFDYIFIDEAASEKEQLTLVPIAGLGSSSKGINAQIILSGDHKQLGSIVKNSFCRRLGMEKSMMERIMETDEKYQKKPNYNQQYVTLLVKNYRSHPAILQFSNENFYESQLVPMCPPKIANFACGWELLMYNKDFPVLFHTAKTPMTEVGTSLANEGEVVLINEYIQALTMYGINGEAVEQSDIGIISPYRAQRDRILEQFEDEFPKVEIGTVDAFQGREKKIIIISTVRSQTKHVGFLRNEKRLNVAITRAKCLLIIIGNSATLQKCLIWNKFIEYCFNNNAIVGDARTFDQAVVNDENYEGNEERPDEVEDEYE